MTHEAVRDRYDELASSYDETARKFGWSTPAMVGQELERLPALAGDALVIGVGTGLDLDAVKAKASGSVLALDIAPRMIEAALDKHPDVRGITTDFFAWDGPGSAFELIVCGGMLEFVRDFAGFFERAAELLTPGGYLVVTHELLIEGHPDYGPKAGSPGGSCRRPTQDLLSAAGSSRLKLARLRHFVAWTGVGAPVVYEMGVLRRRR